MEHKKKNSCRVDVTLPGRSYFKGTLHPLSRSINMLTDILINEGFRLIDAPEIDSEWYNFTALNITKNHPARALADTFYICDSPFLLRTHTSNAQIRSMQNNFPPMKIFSIGRVYRRDFDSTHSPMFHQLEILVVNKTANIVQLKHHVHKILCSFFLTEFPIRFRTSYFPFTEPSFEVDILCNKNLSKGCEEYWLEILGCGMVNDKVFKNVGIINTLNRGFALGVGIERLVMLKHGINDIRDLYNGSLS